MPEAGPPAALAETVSLTNRAGTLADATFDVAPSPPAAAHVTPRRFNRAANRCRPRLSRLATVPTGQPSSVAAPATVNSRTAHSTTGNR